MRDTVNAALKGIWKDVYVPGNNMEDDWLCLSNTVPVPSGSRGSLWACCPAPCIKISQNLELCISFCIWEDIWNTSQNHQMLLAGASCDHLVQPPLRRASQSRLPRMVSSLVLDTSMDGDSKTSLGNLLLFLSTLTIKKKVCVQM